LTPRRILRFLALAVLVLSQCGCAIPLGPGFYAEKELLEVRYVPGAPPHLEIRATFTLENSGDRPLDSIDVSLPDEKDFGRAHLRIEVDGALLSPQPSPDAPESTSRIALHAPWPQKTVHTLVISYDLMKSLDFGPSVGTGDFAFYLPTSDWYPLLRAPKGLFAKGDARPKRFDLSVRVPDGFLVHAAGHPQGKKRRAGESEFRFRIAEQSFSPFVLSGRFHEQQYKDSNGTVLFWTLQPLPADQVQRAGPPLASAAKNFATLFGPLGPGSRHLPMRVVEWGFPQETARPNSGAAVFHHFPAGALINPGGFALGVASEDFLTLVEQSWPWTWARDVARPGPGADETLRHALTQYAAMFAEFSRSNHTTRQFRIRTCLRSFDILSATTKEIPVALLRRNDEDVQYAIGNCKTTLFLVALEDEIGRDKLHRALRRMIQGLRGSTYGFTDLRAALEVESGKDLGEIFRAWLNQPGIPANLRKTYQERE